MRRYFLLALCVHIVCATAYLFSFRVFFAHGRRIAAQLISREHMQPCGERAKRGDEAFASLISGHACFVLGFSEAGSGVVASAPPAGPSCSRETVRQYRCYASPFTFNMGEIPPQTPLFSLALLSRKPTSSSSSPLPCLTRPLRPSSPVFLLRPRSPSNRRPWCVPFCLVGMAGWGNLLDLALGRNVPRSPSIQGDVDPCFRNGADLTRSRGGENRNMFASRPWPPPSRLLAAG
ncbi:hypothetical protein EDB81DRAFT_463773 [Dactylonectria macrodidyma]|uniref:Uncharacterized protein n=1 Tax=Dactylonectria macrodidyma TaxID=307937 RepID=A0A9P9EYT3_9HYPO|nr:hypothetical protein EDB81DRAFT_463773 [Dactylonectria macrodidyma]